MHFNVFELEKLTERMPHVKNDPLSVELLQSTLKDVVSERFAGHKGEVNIVFVDQEEMQRINRETRSIDSSTDVLSFNTAEGSEIFGEVYVSVSDVESNIEDIHYNSVLNESMRVIIHGILHLLGYQHEDYFEEGRDDLEIMFQIQEEMLNDVMNRLNIYKS